MINKVFLPLLLGQLDQFARRCLYVFDLAKQGESLVYLKHYITELNAESQKVQVVLGKSREWLIQY